MKSGEKKLTMTVHEMAYQLGISMPKAYELAKQEGFPSLRLGKQIIIPVDAFHKWLLESVGTGEKEVGR